MNTTATYHSLLNTSRNIYNTSVVYLSLFVVCFFGLHIISYFLYRIVAYYCKWKKSEKSLYQHFQDVIQLVVLTFLYILASNYIDMLNCSAEHLILEYIIPFLISLFFSGFFCEVPYFRVRLIDIKTWELKTWVMFGFLFCVFLFLTIITFIYCERKDLYFLPIIPCLLYLLGGYFLSLFARHPSLRFHPRSYQIAFSLCLLRKENNFYCRLFAAMCTGVFVRCIAANPALSLLEPLEDETQALPTRNSNVSPTDNEEASVQVIIDEDSHNKSKGNDMNRPLLEEDNEELMLQTIEKYNRGEIDDVDLQSNSTIEQSNQQTQLQHNEAILQDDEEIHENPSFLHVSRSSDYGDWSEQQRKELYGDNE